MRLEAPITNSFNTCFRNTCNLLQAHLTFWFRTKNETLAVEKSAKGGLKFVKLAIRTHASLYSLLNRSGRNRSWYLICRVEFWKKQKLPLANERYSDVKVASSVDLFVFDVQNITIQHVVPFGYTSSKSYLTSKWYILYSHPSFTLEVVPFS